MPLEAPVALINTTKCKVLVSGIVARLMEILFAIVLVCHELIVLQGNCATKTEKRVVAGCVFAGSNHQPVAVVPAWPVAILPWCEPCVHAKLQQDQQHQPDQRRDETSSVTGSSPRASPHCRNRGTTCNLRGFISSCEQIDEKEKQDGAILVSDGMVLARRHSLGVEVGYVLKV